MRGAWRRMLTHRVQDRHWRLDQLAEPNRYGV